MLPPASPFGPSNPSALIDRISCSLSAIYTPEMRIVIVARIEPMLLDPAFNLEGAAILAKKKKVVRREWTKTDMHSKARTPVVRHIHEALEEARYMVQRGMTRSQFKITPVIQSTSTIY